MVVFKLQDFGREMLKLIISLSSQGSLITLLSKTTVNSVINTIRNLSQLNISTDIQKSGTFSVQLDTTQDITEQDQCSVILRYVTNVVNERLVAVVRCHESTEQSFVKLLTEVLEHLNLDISMCIGNSIDEAPNMQGQYRGFSALLASQSPNHVHVFCYSHVLNLVLSETTQRID